MIESLQYYIITLRIVIVEIVSKLHIIIYDDKNDGRIIIINSACNTLCLISLSNIIIIIVVVC